MVDGAKKVIAIGSDHAGYQLKNRLADVVEAQGFEVKDYGTFGPEAVDYPDYAHAVAGAVASGQADAGLLLCGAGNGVAITANKYREIRAALCWNQEVASLARKHNDANILCLPARYLTPEEAERIVTLFFTTPFDGGRHQLRIEKISV